MARLVGFAPRPSSNDITMNQTESLACENGAEALPAVDLSGRTKEPGGSRWCITAQFLCWVIASIIGSSSGAAWAETWNVGPSFDFKTPSEIAGWANDGDTILIEAGRYQGDVAVWRQSNLTLKALDGAVVLDAAGRSAEDKAIWVVNGNNVTVDGIEFRNAAVRDRNGAGIRAQGRNLTIKNSVFAFNENGILTVDDDQSNITIVNSRFISNGHGDGYSHGLYIGDVNRFIFQHNYVYGTQVGHHVKSRANSNDISYNFLIDGRHGTASYAVDLPDADAARLVGNIMHQGQGTENYHFVNFEPNSADAELILVNNTVVNEFDSGVFLRLGGDANTTILNNILAGAIDAKGAGEAGNIRLTLSDFVNSQAYDFRLRPGSKAIDAGIALPTVHNRPIAPEFEYRHPAHAAVRVRNRSIDAGAFEFQAE